VGNGKNVNQVQIEDLKVFLERFCDRDMHKGVAKGFELFCFVGPKPSRQNKLTILLKAH
jgi:hypothetical protein